MKKKLGSRIKKAKVGIDLNIPKQQLQEGDRSYYDQFTGNMFLTPDQYNDPNVYNHEAFHDLQHRMGTDRLPQYADLPYKEPSIVNTNDAKSAYYNRKGVDENILGNRFLQQHPDFQFVPNQVIYDKYIDDEQYRQPWTLEGEAKDFENRNRQYDNGGIITNSNMKKKLTSKIKKAANGYDYLGQSTGSMLNQYQEQPQQNNGWSFQNQPLPGQGMQDYSYLGRATNDIINGKVNIDPQTDTNTLPGNTTDTTDTNKKKGYNFKTPGFGSILSVGSGILANILPNKQNTNTNYMPTPMSNPYAQGTGYTPLAAFGARVDGGSMEPSYYTTHKKLADGGYTPGQEDLSRFSNLRSWSTKQGYTPDYMDKNYDQILNQYNTQFPQQSVDKQQLGNIQNWAYDQHTQGSPLDPLRNASYSGQEQYRRVGAQDQKYGPGTQEINPIKVQYETIGPKGNVTSNIDYGYDYAKAARNQFGDLPAMDYTQPQQNINSPLGGQNSNPTPYQAPTYAKQDQQANWHTNEDADYSIDSLRTGKYGLNVYADGGPIQKEGFFPQQQQPNYIDPQYKRVTDSTFAAFNPQYVDYERQQLQSIINNPQAAEDFKQQAKDQLKAMQSGINPAFKKEDGGEIEKGKSGIHIKKSHKGLLHKNLDVPDGKKIPTSKLAIKSTDSSVIKKRKQFAINAKSWSKKEDGGIVEGQEMELTPEEIQQYISKGYQFDF